MTTATIDRADLIDRCSDAVGRDCDRRKMNIAEARAFKHRETGVVYRANGIPRGVTRDQLELIPDGFVFERDGVHYRRFATRELAQQFQEEYRAAQIADFRAAVEQQTDEQLETTAAYWLQ